jgi:hypothetical protein
MAQSFKSVRRPFRLCLILCVRFKPLKPFNSAAEPAGTLAFSMHKLFTALFLLLNCSVFAQTLPDLDIPITSRNYHEICKQLDDYFADEYLQEEDTDCWDNKRVKYERWKWWWRDRVKADRDRAVFAEKVVIGAVIGGLLLAILVIVIVVAVAANRSSR